MTSDPNDNIILGILSEADAPCIEAPDSPEVKVGEAQTLLSTNTDNPPSSEFFQDIRSVRTVTVKRSFTCLKEDFHAVRNWLAGLDGRALQVNVGKNGKSVLAGGFRLTGPIEMASESPSLARVEAEWAGYILDCNIDLAPSIRFRKDSDTQWSIMCGDTVALTVNSSGPGDGTGLLIVPEETVTWDHLPDDVKQDATPSFVAVKDIPETAAQCAAYVNGGTAQYTEIMSRNPETGKPTSSVTRQFSFPTDPFAYRTKWRALRLKCNGEVAITWWVRVSHTAQAVTNSSKLTVLPVYYGQTAAEITENNGTIHGPIDITDRTNGRLATSLLKTDAIVEYTGNAGPEAWAFRPDVTLDIDREIVDEIGASTDPVPASTPTYNFIYTGENWQKGGKEYVEGLVYSTLMGNYWAFPAFPGDTDKSIRFRTDYDIYVRRVEISTSGQVTVYTYKAPLIGLVSVPAHTVGTPSGSADNAFIRQWWTEPLMNGKTRAEMAMGGSAGRAMISQLEANARDNAHYYNRSVRDTTPGESSSLSPSASASGSPSGSSGSDFYTVYLSPFSFMRLMEKKINEWLVENGYLSSVDDEDAFHYDLEWTSRDTITITVGQDLPEDVGNPILADYGMLSYPAGFKPENIDTGYPDVLRTLTLASATTNTSPYAPFAEKGCYSCKAQWSLLDDSSSTPQTVTYEQVFRRVMKSMDSKLSDADASPSAYGFNVLRTGFHFPGTDASPLPIAAYGRIGFVFASEEVDEDFGGDNTGDSIIRLFWREDSKNVTLLANNAFGKNPLLSFRKTEA